VSRDAGNPREQALNIAATIGPVFPLRPMSKVPMLSREQGGRGCLDATRDPAIITGWWERWPSCNIGLATGTRSGIYVVDVDGNKGGAETMRRLVEEHGRIPDTLRSRTGSGWHLFFRLPPTPVRQGANVLGPGVDTRSTGGYVVAPPSVHPSGARYRWITDARPAPMPGWLALLCAPPPAPAAPPSRDPHPRDVDAVTRARAWLATLDGAVSGQGGHRQTYRAACGLVRGFVLPPDVALALLLSDFNPRCRPPWREKDLRHKIESACASTLPLGYLLHAPRRAA
jgi:hypothetical protein